MTTIETAFPAGCSYSRTTATMTEMFPARRIARALARPIHPGPAGAVAGSPLRIAALGRLAARSVHAHFSVARRGFLVLP